MLHKQKQSILGKCPTTQQGWHSRNSTATTACHSTPITHQKLPQLPWKINASAQGLAKTANQSYPPQANQSHPPQVLKSQWGPWEWRGHSIYLFLIFWSCCMACGILVPWPRIEPVPLAVEARSLNHWTTREVPGRTFNNYAMTIDITQLPQENQPCGCAWWNLKPHLQASLGNIFSFPASVVKEDRIEGGCSRCWVNIREFMDKYVPKRLSSKYYNNYVTSQKEPLCKLEIVLSRLCCRGSSVSILQSATPAGKNKSLRKTAFHQGWFSSIFATLSSRILFKIILNYFFNWGTADVQYHVSFRCTI